MGVVVRVTLFAKDPSTAKNAAQAAFDRFRTIDEVGSDYILQSELNQLSNKAGTGWVPVSTELYAILQHSQRISTLTEGAFDITVGTLTKLWRESRKAKQLPTESVLRTALKASGYRTLLLDRQKALLTVPGVRLDLGGVAKGYACDEAILAIGKAGVECALVEAGGDLAVSAPPPGLKGWKIKVPTFGEPVDVSYCAVSTSGDAEQFFEIDGARYSHTINPKTGLGLKNQVQATVIARWGALTDPLATAVCVDRSVTEPIIARFGGKVYFKTR